MKPTWLIERGIYKEYAVAMKAEVEQQGMDCFEVDYRPGKSPPSDIVGCRNLADDACVVLWGTLPLMQQVQIHHSWVPGGWCNIENLDCRPYCPRFGQLMLNHRYSILPGIEAIRLKDDLFNEFGSNDEIFVRPSGMHKTFPGKVAYKDDFCDFIAATRFDPTIRVLVATPKEIGREWRLVVAEDKVVAASQYRYNGALVTFPDYSEQVSRFADEVLRQVRWRPDRLFVMDICESENRLHVLELNSFSCSGFYECEAAAIVRAASEVAESEWNVGR